MPQTNRAPFRLILRSGCSVAVIVAAFWFRRFVMPFGVHPTPFVTVFPAVVLVSLFAGLWMGLMATVVSALMVDFWIFAPAGRLKLSNPGDTFLLVAFLVVSTLVCLLLEQSRRRQARIAELEGRQRLRAAEEKLQTSSEYRKLALEAASLGAWDYDFPSKHLRWDECFRSAFWISEGYRAHYEQVLARIHPDDRQETVAAATYALAGGNSGVFHREFRVVWPDGSIHWVSTHGRAYFEGEGNDRHPVRFIGVAVETTDSKQIREELTASEARYRSLTESIPAMVWAADCQGLRTNQNRRWREYTGQTHEQALGNGWRQVVHPDDLQHVLDCWNHSSQTGADYQLEYRIRRFDGVYRWHRVHARLRTDDSGASLGWFGFSIDIDDQRRAESRLRRFYETDLFAILYWKIDGSIIDANERFLKLTGYTRDEVRAGLLDWDRITPPEYQDLDLDASRQLQETGVLPPYEKEFIRKDGTRAWGQFSAATYEDDPTQGISFILDVTERKRAEAALQESERQLRTLADAIPQLCWTAEPDGSLDWFNRRWYQYTGTTFEQGKGWGWQSVMDPHQLPAVVARWKGSLAAGAPFDMVVGLRRTDGVFRPFLIRVVPVRGAAGTVTRWFGTGTDISEQKQIEAELRNSRERLNLALEVAKIGEWERDAVTDHASRSPRHAQIFGYSDFTPAWSFNKFLEHILPEARAAALQRIQSAKANDILDFETQIRRVDGEIRWIWVRSHNQPDETGRLAHISGVVMDVTDRKRVEEALRQQAELLDLAYDAIMVCDLDGTIRFWNHGAEQIYGYSREDVTGQNAHVLLNTAFPAPISEVKTLVLEQGRWEGELAQTTRDGRGMVVASRWALRRDHRGQPSGIMEINTDITERTRADEARRQAHMRLQSVLDSITDGMMELDEDWRVTYLNEQGARLAGFVAGELIGRNIWESFPHAANTRFNEALHAAAKNRLPAHAEDFYPEPLNLWFECHCYPSRDGLTVYFRDISERKKAEQALLRSEKLASVGRMAATIAHEINNPLAAVTNLLFLVESMEGMPEPARQYLEAADAELKRVAHIVRQSLGFYRESNAPALVSVDSILDSAVDLMKSKIKEKQAVIERSYDADNVQLTAMAGELRQVFSNLLGNSLDAIAEKGRVQLHITAHVDRAAGRRSVRITVADSGPGIVAEARRHIFEPFFTTKGNLGTGLGLWVCKQIVDKHRGTIHMRSSTCAAYHGAVFSVVLPLDLEPSSKALPAPGGTPEMLRP